METAQSLAWEDTFPSPLIQCRGLAANAASLPPCKDEYNVIAKDKVVLFEYRLTDDEGTLIDSSEEAGPMAYLHGHDNLVPGLEAHLEGMDTGAEFSVRIEAAQGYGLRDESLVAEVPLGQFGDDKVKPGMAFDAETDHGPITVIVKSVGDKIVEVDANPPLAGVALNFEGTVVEVREPSPEELAHGHVHGPGGHDH
jgi:FKBP-type peptidyl-prolyl cis-trans isomerase SlyD